MRRIPLILMVKYPILVNNNKYPQAGIVISDILDSISN